MKPPPSPLEARSLVAAGLVSLLATGLVGALATGDHDLFKTLAVGVLAAVTTIVGFYFGSSKSSQAKDETLSTLAARCPK